MAIGLHWLMAVLIIGMLAVGKYMTGLDQSDPVRFVLTQWHKSFGILILVLAVIRLIWRFIHTPPPLEIEQPLLEIWAARTVHFALYFLMIALPVTGWIMVSVSPLDISTILFDTLYLPHLPYFNDLPKTEALAGIFLSAHDIAGNILILLLLGHLGAVVKHHVFHNTPVLKRMAPKSEDQTWATGLPGFVLVSAVLVAAFFVYANNVNRSVPLVAGASQVSFEFLLSGEKTQGIFTESTVQLDFNQDRPEAGSLNAMVDLSSVDTGNSQIDSTLMQPDWFDIKLYPDAKFVSQSIEIVTQNELKVTGELTLKEKTQVVEFPMVIVESESSKKAMGEFAVDRLTFDMGLESQADDETVGYDVLIQFEFEIADSNAQ